MKCDGFNFSRNGLVLVLLFFSLTVSGCTLNAFERSDEVEAAALPTPSPEFSPDNVVRIQLEALQHKDRTNKGIETTFNFASPDNKKVTGPLSRFIKLVRNQPYSAMLNHQSAEYEPVKISGDTAVQRVKLIGSDGSSIIYIFKLSRQSAAPYENCWMTDAVTVEPTRELPRDEA
jgi:hypothetical protein